DSVENTIADADALVLMPEWNVYRGLNLDKVKLLMSGAVFIDLRNVYEKDRVQSHGFEYSCVGR
ncbi:MAG: UDP-glucose 6-dehydrogenase, partial [Halieaceae bacterium]|nr:UDP-glucose 6-dehydrogenase [Halieaceae bacterium]